VNVLSLRRALDGIVAGDFNDPTNERLIYLSAAGLAVIGLGLLFGTLVWWRRGRQEHPALAPLEVMSTRTWANANEGDRRRKLEQVRLSGAAGSVEEPIVADPFDLEALVRSVPEDFDDLREPSAVIAVPAAADAVAEESVAVDEPADEGSVVAVDDPADDEGTPDQVEAEADAMPVAEEAPIAEPAKSEPAKSRTKSKPKKSAAKSKSESVQPDVDATSISTERPIVSPEPPAKVPADSTE
jgi:hypothetical protein